MLSVISPAKTLDFDSPNSDATFTRPAFPTQSRKLIALLKEKSVEEIQKLMSLSEALGKLNVQRYKKWKSPAKLGPAARQAGYAFMGDVYQGLDFASLEEDDKSHAQDHLRILSGLYGILKPLDLIAPHRLEMGTSLPNPNGRSLYAFWADTQTKFLNRELKRFKKTTLINLASDEYFKSVKAAQLKATIVTPRFLDSNDGKNYKVISFYAKRARGLMARWLIQSRAESSADLVAFSEDRYTYDPSASTEDTPVFKRSHT